MLYHVRNSFILNHLRFCKVACANAQEHCAAAKYMVGIYSSEELGFGLFSNRALHVRAGQQRTIWKRQRDWSRWDRTVNG